MNPEPGEITRLALRWSDGDEEAFGRLFELVYEDLKRIARHHLAVGGRDGMVDTTVLVHEAYLRLANVGTGEWRGRGAFFAFCSKAMRRILIDFARRRTATKRGGGDLRVTLTPESAAVENDVMEILMVEELLQAVEAHSPRMARVVECRFFGGLSVPETAEALALSPRTVDRDWMRARTYLARLVADDRAREGGSPEADPR